MFYSLVCFMRVPGKAQTTHNKQITTKQHFGLFYESFWQSTKHKQQTTHNNQITTNNKQITTKQRSFAKYPKKAKHQTKKQN